MIGSPPEGEGLEFTFRDYDCQRRVAKERLANSEQQIQHVGSTRRAEVSVPLLESAGGIVFEVWLVTAQTVFANMVRGWVEVRDEDAGVVAALPADDLATGQRIDPPQPGLLG
jgi:hypothetical protein